jgi:hypothetical protein
MGIRLMRRSNISAASVEESAAMQQGVNRKPRKRSAVFIAVTLLKILGKRSRNRARAKDSQAINARLACSGSRDGYLPVWVRSA